jgi:3-methyladenine DNA glycosylase AlkD
MPTEEIQRELASLEDASQAAVLKRFFKTGPGEYGEGDRFRGIRVPVLRKMAGKYRQLSVVEAGLLLRSAFHEDRLLALIILIDRYYKGEGVVKSNIHHLYLKRTRFVNNWDLVDVSAPHLLGHYLRDRSKDILSHLAASTSLWERRMAIMATFSYIKAGNFDETLRIARLLLDDSEDLIHKAVGWMLREVSKREITVAEAFLRAHQREMPRTMLRYAIEKFPQTKRQAYLKETPL